MKQLLKKLHNKTDLTFIESKSAFELLMTGKASEDEIYDFLSNKYGDWILYKPKLNFGNFLLWFFPYFVLLIGALIILHLVRKKVKKT